MTEATVGDLAARLEPLPPGGFRCCGCGRLMFFGRPGKHRQPAGLSFALFGCIECACLMTKRPGGGVRRLNRKEVAEIRRSDQRDYIARCVATVTDKLIG